MARPSIAEQRRRQILEAFATCVMRTGIVRLTLDDVAREANLQRSVLRHFVGNRDQLVQSAILHFSELYWRSFREHVDALPDAQRLDGVLGFLFDGPFSESHRDEGRLLDSLIAGTSGDPEAQTALREMYARFHEGVASELQHAFPDASPEAVRDVAYGVMGVAESHATLADLALPAATAERALRIARRLIAQLAP